MSKNQTKNPPKAFTTKEKIVFENEKTIIPYTGGKFSIKSIIISCCGYPYTICNNVNKKYDYTFEYQVIFCNKLGMENYIMKFSSKAKADKMVKDMIDRKKIDINDYI